MYRLGVSRCTGIRLSAPCGWLLSGLRVLSSMPRGRLLSFLGCPVVGALRRARVLSRWSGCQCPVVGPLALRHALRFCCGAVAVFCLGAFLLPPVRPVLLPGHLSCVSWAPVGGCPTLVFPVFLTLFFASVYEPTHVKVSQKRKKKHINFSPPLAYLS